MNDRSTIHRWTLVLALCLVASSILTSAAGARPPKASVSLALPSSVSENAAVPFSWTGKHLGPKHRLVIQRPVGTARVWKTMLRLSGNNGAAELPGFPLGVYRLRIADLVGRRVLAKQVVSLAVFGPVPFSSLFGYSTHVYSTPTSSFPYVTTAGHTEQPAFKVEENPCLSVHVEFVPGQRNGPGTGTLTLVQETRDPVVATAAYDTVGSLDAQLTPGQSWAVNTSYNTSTPADWEPNFYINGFAICSSTQPVAR